MKANESPLISNELFGGASPEMEDREFALVQSLNNLAFTLREIVEYHVPESHPDFTLAMDEIQQAEEVIKGIAA